MAKKVKVKAVENFHDLERNVNVKVGDVFETSSKKRAEELNGEDNKQKKQLVEIIGDVEEPETGKETDPDKKENEAANADGEETETGQDAEGNADDETGASGEEK
jgi:hypothetical protein